MKKWYNEEYEFTVEVTGFLHGNHTERYCRNGEEIGDKYTCTYGCPVNQDGTADASDLALIEGWLLGKGDFSGCWQPADFNDDCQINAVDMSLLKRSF